ncbi:hypothetical protein [Saccharothrix syringae]|uniref:hypothetical protein n=1 Tax=Saccharothrix syringae TaxID=103733 RepID=UPI000A454D0C|nr:hypothetical protein [Saccharothrix syringae]
MPEAPKLHQPKRAFVAAGEVVLGVLLVLAAAWCWQRGVVHQSYPTQDGRSLAATRYHGNWIGTAVALGTATGVLLLDAVRQAVLAFRTRGPAPQEYWEDQPEEQLREQSEEQDFPPQQTRPEEPEEPERQDPRQQDSQPQETQPQETQPQETQPQETQATPQPKETRATDHREQVANPDV